MWWANRCITAISFLLALAASAQPSIWTRATNDIPWAPRVGEAIVGHDGKLWMVGGSLDERGGCRNDVWVSTDGVSWEQVVEHAPWTPRNGHAAVSFQGKLWILGGFDCERMLLGDVWSSEDGLTWEKIGNPPWEPRSEHGAVVFQDKLWVLGGGLGESHPYNDVWYSEDGETWTQAPGATPWAARTAFASAVHDKKLWILGGRTNYGEWVRDVWYTEDGVMWHSAGGAPWSARYATACLSHGDKLWLFGGRTDRQYQDNAESNEIWSTTDGTDWVLEREHADWTPRTDHMVLEFQEKLYLLGGRSPLGDGTEIWVSNDAVVWSSALGNRWGPRVRQATIQHDGYLWVIGGAVPKGQPTDIWRSKDGHIWENVTYEASWEHLIGTAAVSFQGRMWVLGMRRYRSEEACVWSSADGSVWEEAATPPWAGRMGHSATVYDGKIWVVGGIRSVPGGNPTLNDVWYSVNGENWHEVTTVEDGGQKGLAPVGARWNHAAAVYDGKLWIAGGLDINGQIVGDVWWTEDGSQWTCATEIGPFLQLDGPELVAFRDHLWLVGGSSIRFNGVGGSGRKVWITQDGKNWASYGGDVPWDPRQDPGVLVLGERLWLLGGEAPGHGGRTNDVWYTEGLDLPPIPERGEPIVPVTQAASVNLAGKTPAWIGTLGVDWITVKTDAEVPGRTGVEPFVFEDKLWLPDGNQFWRSSDGTEWTRVTPTEETYFGTVIPWAPTRSGTEQQELLWDIRANQSGGGSVWNSKDGVRWTPIRKTIDWEADGGWAFAFRNKLWYVGGMRPVRWTNRPQSVSRTWASEDGENWVVVKEQAPWDGFEGYDHFLFAGKIWIVGGHDQNGRPGGVWVSEDGVDWHEVTEKDELLVSPDEDCEWFSTGERLWALSHAGGTARNLWSTVDGKHWEQHVENLALVQGEQYFGIEHDGLWLIPRDDGSYRRGPGTIVHSSDLKNWRQFAFDGPTMEMFSSKLVVHEDKFWMFDAEPNEEELPLSRVLSSPNGINWTLETDSSAWGKRVEMGVVSHAGKLWILGGYDAGRFEGNPGSMLNDVWSSENGKDWTRVLDAAPWKARTNPAVVSLNGKLILLCGENPEVRGDNLWLRDAWASTDGVTWEPLVERLPFRLSGDGSPPLVHNGKIWVLGAMEREPSKLHEARTQGENISKIWNSHDGITWNNVVPDKTWIPRYNVGAVAHDGRIWAIGGVTESEWMSDTLPHMPVDRVEWTKDGISWTVVSTLPLDPMRNYDDYYSMGGRMWRVSYFPDAISFSGSGK